MSDQSVAAVHAYRVALSDLRAATEFEEAALALGEAGDMATYLSAAEYEEEAFRRALTTAPSTLAGLVGYLAFVEGPLGFGGADVPYEDFRDVLSTVRRALGLIANRSSERWAATTGAAN